MVWRVQSWGHVFVYTTIVVALAVAAPFALIWFFMPPWAPGFVQVPFFVTGALVPLLVSAPVAFFGLYMFKLVNATVDMLDQHVKFDPLTGLLSRSFFLATAEMSRKAGGYFLMIDADHFKRVNDTHGHDGGDAALKVISRLIQTESTVVGLAGRLGGEEFAVYYPNINRTAAMRRAEALNKAVRSAELELNGKRVALTVSIGLAEDMLGTSFAHTMKAADLALYAAKSAGRDRLVVAGPENRKLEIAA